MLAELPLKELIGFMDQALAGYGAARPMRGDLRNFAEQRAIPL